MGSFFTNVHVRVGDGVAPAELADRLRRVAEAQLAEEGFAIADDGDADREIVIVPTDRWLAFYDARTADQDDRVERWARDISRELDTVAFSILVHDSDVLAMTLFAGGKRCDAYDSNPGFSGKRASKLAPEARARKWARVIAPGHDIAELAAAFASRPAFAEAALALVAPAVGADHGSLCTGYNYLTREGVLPPDAIRIRGRFASRPAWERRMSGTPRFGSLWDPFGIEAPEPEPQRVLVGQPLHANATVKNLGGAGRGLRIAVAASNDCIALAKVEVVITKPGRFQMDRYPADLVRDADGRFVAEIAEAVLQPGFAGTQDALAGAPLDAMMDAHHAGQVHINVLGRAAHTGDATLFVDVVPLEHPAGAHTARVIVEVIAPEGLPLRCRPDAQPHELDRLTGDAHSYLLVVIDAPRERVKAHAIDLLASIAWPSGTWDAFTVDTEHQLTKLTVKKAAVWPTLHDAIRATTGSVSGIVTPRGSDDSAGASGFEIDVRQELGAVGIWLAKARVDQSLVERALTAAVDAIARQGALVQAVLARWHIESGGVTTPYEDVVGIQGDFTATRRWATRWLRGIGRGQLWLGSALRDRLPAALPDRVELATAIRIPVSDVGATEAALAALLPTCEDGWAFDQQA